MTRRCSHCSNNGHNSRTCPARGVKLFGVRLTDGYIKKSASMGNLTHYPGTANPSSPSDPSEPTRIAEGYASDDLAHASCSSSCRERKKGTPWTEEEHRLFLVGLQKLGKGDWRGIARNFVVSRTPTQVASHAQKYFIRQTNSTRRKRRSSLFDIAADMPIDPIQAREEQFLLGSTPVPAPNPIQEPENTTLPPLHPMLDQEHETSQCISSADLAGEPEETGSGCNYPVIYPDPAFFPVYFPFPPPFWQQNMIPAEEEREIHPVLRPTPVLSKDPININELIGLSTLSLQEAPGQIEPSALTGKLLGDTTRQSAFHVNRTVGQSDLNQSNGSAIHAV